MGMVIKGVWDNEARDAVDESGAFIRSDSAFRDWVTADGASGFIAEAGRYHLFASPNCPWAHRALIFRKLKKLEDVIGVSIADRPKTAGWSYSQGPGEDGDGFDAIDGAFRLSQLYTATKPDYTGKVTVPTLWDRKTRTVVNNESSEIIRMFNSAFGAFTDDTYDYYPEELRGDIDAVNDLVYGGINNGTYRCGFAKSQQAYEDAFAKLFDALDQVEERLARHRYLMGNRITEADWRLFPTLLRFDLVYYSHFKCNLRRIADYPNLYGYLCELYQWPGVRETCDLQKIKAGYYSNQVHINPTGIVPVGPELHLDDPHDRDRFAKAA